MRHVRRTRPTILQSMRHAIVHQFTSIQPNITEKRAPLADAEKFDGETGKLGKYFSEEPGEGD
jgi:ferredoxin